MPRSRPPLQTQVGEDSLDHRLLRAPRYLVQHRLHSLIARRRDLKEDRLAKGVPVHTIQDQAVQVDVEVGGRAEALDERDQRRCPLRLP